MQGPRLGILAGTMLTISMSWLEPSPVKGLGGSAWKDLVPFVTHCSHQRVAGSGFRRPSITFRSWWDYHLENAEYLVIWTWIVGFALDRKQLFHKFKRQMNHKRAAVELAVRKYGNYQVWHVLWQQLFTNQQLHCKSSHWKHVGQPVRNSTCQWERVVVQKIQGNR